MDPITIMIIAGLVAAITFVLVFVMIRVFKKVASRASEETDKKPQEELVNNEHAMTRGQGLGLSMGAEALSDIPAGLKERGNPVIIVEVEDAEVESTVSSTVGDADASEKANVSEVRQENSLNDQQGAVAAASLPAVSPVAPPSREEGEEKSFDDMFSAVMRYSAVVPHDTVKLTPENQKAVRYAKIFLEVLKDESRGVGSDFKNALKVVLGEKRKTTKRAKRKAGAKGMPVFDNPGSLSGDQIERIKDKKDKIKEVYEKRMGVQGSSKSGR